MAENDWVVWGIPLITVGSYFLITGALFTFRKWLRGPMYKGTTRMDGKNVVITGANTGIGKETARDLARRGANVTILCRNVERANAAAEDIRATTGAEISIVECDLASFESIRRCAQELKEKVPKIHVLINNAGVVSPKWKTKDGIEMQFGTNHLGHFLLTNLLLENIKDAAPSRIVVVSSLAHESRVFVYKPKIHWGDIEFDRKKYDPMVAYSQSKLANVMFANKLARDLEGTGVSVYSLHPGVIKTDLGRNDTYGSSATKVTAFMFALFAKNTVLGAQTTIYCAVDEAIANNSGFYYSDCKQRLSSKDSRDEAAQDKLWELSAKMTHLDAQD